MPVLTTPFRVLPLALACTLALGARADAQRGQTTTGGDWRAYAGDARATKYSPLADITRENVSRLSVAWRWSTADKALQASDPAWRASRNEDTPLYVKGTLYTVTPLGLVAAIDPGTGTTRWVYDPESYKTGRPTNVGFTNRGLAFWSDGTADRLMVATPDAYLLSIDTATGKPDPAFGVNGKADAIQGIPKATRATNLSGRRPLVAGDVVVVGSTVSDGAANMDTNPPGYVNAFDARTGRLVWTFHTVPKKGERGYESWLEGSADYSGNANVWGGMAYDAELGYVYLATSTATNDYYGGHRPGDNLFAESVVCVNAKTGAYVWHFQTVHHGVWDYDLPADPILGDLTVNGRKVPAVIQVSKQAFTYVLDRRTGAPVWPIEERPVPQSTVPRERTAATQPIPSKPPAFDLQGTTPDNLIDFTPELKTRALEKLNLFEHGPVFTPPSLKGTIVLPGMFGGANWGGAGFDPETGTLYVPSRMYPSVERVAAQDPKRTNLLYRNGGAGPSVDDAVVDGLPIFKPPYSRVTALDLNRGDRTWMAPLGNGPRNHPLLKDLKVGPLGDQIHGGSVLVTKTLLFVSVTHLQYNGQPNPPKWAAHGDRNMTQKAIYVFDKSSGQLVHTIEHPMGAAAPMTFTHNGRQMIVFAAGGGENCELVAMALPRP
jgi:quinoprotein glucose dehydrogenase